MLMRISFIVLFILLCNYTFAESGPIVFYKSNHPFIKYTGRVDFSDPEKPKFWASGTYLQIKFSGTYLNLKINDQMLYGNVLNYLEIKVDNEPAYRIQLKGKENIISLAKNLSKGTHTIIICKNTEPDNGYVQILGIECSKLLKPAPQQKRKMEFIGDSMTCGTGSDESGVKCKNGQWYDQHNAYSAYGPATARSLNARWQLSSVSGIGLIHSCCNKKTVMPQVFDKINMAQDTIAWDFKRYQADVVTVCLGQNDGIQDSTQFVDAYISFASKLRQYYPKARLIFLPSPMADTELKTVLVKYITAVKNHLYLKGDKNIGTYTFAKQYHQGCDGHPTMAEHQEIALELSKYIKKTLNW